MLVLGFKCPINCISLDKVETRIEEEFENEELQEEAGEGEDMGT